MADGLCPDCRGALAEAKVFAGIVNKRREAARDATPAGRRLRSEVAAIEDAFIAGHEAVYLDACLQYYSILKKEEAERHGTT